MSERLWAPWRITYIKQVKDPNDESCLFDELAQQTNDRDNLVLFRGKTAYVLLNAYPYINGHLMIAPYKHTDNLSKLNNEELLEINQLLAKCVQWLQKAYEPQGFNIGINIGRVAGAGVIGHVHWHIVPRWNGDHNFMTTLGQTRVITEELLETYDNLSSIIKRES